jgi:hypothetical protein
MKVLSFGSKLEGSGLPVSGLPRQEKRRSKHRVRVEFCEIRNAVVQSFQSNACVVECEISCLIGLGDPCKMRCRKCENGVHHK